MKLKRLFWASFPLFFLISCASNKDVVPGQQSVIEKNIYSEYMKIADEYYNLKKYDKAQVYYKECLSFPEYLNVASYKLAKTYVMQKKYKDAISIYEKLIESDDDNQTLIESIAYCYAMSGDYIKAENKYVFLIENYGNQSSYFENLIIVYIQDKKNDKAKEYLDLLKEKFPDCSNITVLEQKLN